jgi:hypothetical protein
MAKITLIPDWVASVQPRGHQRLNFSVRTASDLYVLRRVTLTVGEGCMVSIYFGILCRLG